MYLRNVGHVCVLLHITWTVALLDAAIVSGASPADVLAEQIQDRVHRSVRELVAPPGESCSVLEFESSAVPASWSEIWPDASGREVSGLVNAAVWNAPIQAALAKYGAAFLPKRDDPYYLSDPIVLSSGQSLCADPEAEIRLVPGTNTCMVRNEHLVSGQEGPIPPDTAPDSSILVEGGIWTTLATTSGQSNGNEQGWPSRQERSLHCHGVVLFSNVRALVIRKLTVRQSRAHAVQVSNCSDFLIADVTFDEHRRDGIHVNGPASYGAIFGIRGVTGDDFVALNAWDWSNTVPSFGPIHHVLVDGIFGNPGQNGTDEIRLLPGTKTFADGRKLDCPVADCVFRDLHDIRTFKIYDQPNLELGRDRDFSDPIGAIQNVYFQKLTFNRPGRFQIAANVAGLAIEDVQLNFDLSSPDYRGFQLVEIGPMSQTYKIEPEDPSSWVELFSPDRDITVRGFRLKDIHAKSGDSLQPLPSAESDLVSIADQKPNLDYPGTTPRGGKGRAIYIR